MRNAKSTASLNDLKDTQMWVGWRENPEGRKVPLNPKNGRAAASNNPETWDTWTAAEKFAQRFTNGRLSGVGIMLGPVPGRDSLRLCGVDLDGCVDPETRDLAPWGADVVKRFASYTEFSPSGTGAHILFLCTESDFTALRDAGLLTDKGGAEFSIGDHTEIAAFLGARYFTVTEDRIGHERSIRRVSRKTLEWLLKEHGPAFQIDARKGKPTPKGGDLSGSGMGFKYLCDQAASGLSENEARAAIAGDKGVAGEWWHRAGKRQQDRTVKNAFARIEKKRSALADKFDDDKTEDGGDCEAADLIGITLEEFQARYCKHNKPKAPDPIAKMNQRHAVVVLPNRVAVANIHTDRVEFISERDLELLYKNRRFGKNSLAKTWMAHKDRRTYEDGVTFDPTGRERPGILNLWTGWPVAPDSSAECGLILAHIRDVLCAGNEGHFRYVIGWMADLVQNPAQKPGVALVFKGGKGAGKDTLAVILRRIIGQRHVAHVTRPDALTQRFNAPFATALLCHVEEAFWSGAQDKKGTLQALITSETMPIEKKGIDTFEVDSFLRVLMTTNESWAVPASPDERRFAVFDVSNSRIGDKAYFRALYAEINGGGPAAFLAHLLDVDLSDFDVRDMPRTEALRNQKLATLRGVERWWFEVLHEGDIGEFDWEKPVTVERDYIRERYESFIRENRHQGDPVNATQFGIELRKMVPSLGKTRPREDGKLGKRMYILPSLGQCRAHFAEHLDEHIDWGDED